MAQRKEELEREITDTQASQIQLNRAADDFRTLHAERQDLLKQWDEAVEALHRWGGGRGQGEASICRACLVLAAEA